MKKIIQLTIGLLLIAISFNISAQNIHHLKENTMTSFKSGMNEVTFRSQGIMLAGLIFTPANFDATKKYATVLFSQGLSIK